MEFTMTQAVSSAVIADLYDPLYALQFKAETCNEEILTAWSKAQRPDGMFVIQVTFKPTHE